METMILILLQTIPVASVIIIVGVRIEHRLTKVETEIEWLTKTINGNCNQCHGDTEKKE